MISHIGEKLFYGQEPVYKKDTNLKNCVQLNKVLNHYTLFSQSSKKENISVLSF